MIKLIIYSSIVLVLIVFSIIISILINKRKKSTRTYEVIYDLLPHLNCGQCGRKKCIYFAEDLAKGRTTSSRCPFLKSKNYIKIRQVLKRERKVRFDNVAFVKCKGGCDCKNTYDYVGDKTCSSKNLLHNGDKYCPFACLGCGDCIQACQYGAISISDKGCAIIDKDKCVGCGECVAACPNHLIELIPTDKYVEVVCKNSSTNPVVTRNCSVACTHCEACVVACPEGAITMVGGLPKIDATKCTKCGKCVAACPQHVISRI